MNLGLAFVEACDGDGREVHRPHAVVDFFEGDVLRDKRLTQKHWAMVPRKRTDAGDATNLHMTRVLELGQVGWQRSGRRRVAGRRRTVLQGFMWALVVVFATKPDEAPLLRARV